WVAFPSILMSDSSALHSVNCSDGLNLRLFDKDCLIAHSLAVQHVDRFENSNVVFEFDIPKGRRNARHQVANNSDEPRFNSARLHPFLQLTVGAVIGNIHEKQFKHSYQPLTHKQTPAAGMQS